MDANPFLPGTPPRSVSTDLSKFQRTALPGSGGGDDGAFPPPGDSSDAEPNIWSRFTALFSSPRKAFAPPRGRSFWLIPLIVAALLQGVSALLLSDLYVQSQREAIESSTQFSDEQRAEILERMDQSQSESGIQIVQAAIGIVLGVLFKLVVPAALLMFGINFGVGGAVRFLDSLGVLSLTSLVYVIREAITIPLKLSQQTTAIFTGPAAFLSKDAGILYHVATMFDLFDVYRLFLVIVGLSIVGKVTMGRSAAVVLAFWGLFVIVQIGFRLSPLGALAP